MVVKLSMYMDIEEPAELECSKLEHHIERLLDLASWPEIKSVYKVRCEMVE